MWFVLRALIALLLVWQPASVMAKGPTFKTPNEIFVWFDTYQDDPKPARVSAAVHDMRRLGLFKDLDQAGLLIGFVAGVLGDNQSKAEKLVAKMFPMPPREQVVIIKAIAFSGNPYWPELLNKFAERMPARRDLIDKFISGEEKTLMERPLEEGPDVIDALWGFRSATGYHEPVLRIISALRWADEEDDLDKLTVASKAKWTLAAAAERDRDLLNLYRLHIEHQPKEIAEPLKEVADAAEAYEATRLRKDAIASVDDLKRKGPKKASWSWASQVGQTALSVGCVIATALGHPEIAAPCIVTGALATGVTKLLQLKDQK